MAVRVAVDATGREYAPRAMAHGAVQARADGPDPKPVLVEDEGRIQAEPAPPDANRSAAPIHTLYATQVATTDDSPVEILRPKRDSVVCITCQGRSKENAVRNAVKTARKVAVRGFIDEIMARLGEPYG